MRQSNAHPNPTHQAVILSSGRIIPVERIGRLLVHYRWRNGITSLSTFRYDGRFHLFPKSCDLVDMLALRSASVLAQNGVKG